ncbi:MAG: NAD-dependent epimerase/dehydratase family protein, partial [Acidobacteriota bacterium]
MRDRKPGVIVVTGSEGAIGSAVCQALEGRFRVVGVDRDCKDSSHECVAVDLTSDESVRLGLAEIKQQHGSRIASVLHLAAYFDLSGEPNPLYDTVNVDGTRRLLRALQGFDVEQFVYASTMLVHAPTRPGLPIAEDAPLEANWPYPQSKLKAEEAIREHHGRIPYVLLRIAGVYNDRCGSAFLAHQIRRIYERHLAAHLYAADPAIGQSFV